MKIVSFNVNGVRARLHQLSRVIDDHSPDLIGLQEIKVSDQDFPVKAIEDLGYSVLYHGQKTHYGVALLSKTPAVSVQKGFPTDLLDAQRRVIIGDYELNGQMLRVINGYFPREKIAATRLNLPIKPGFTMICRLICKTPVPLLQYSRDW